MIATIMKIFYPVFGTVLGLSLTALYAVSVYGQAGPDYLDPRYPSPSAWYIRLGCDIAAPYGAVKKCQLAKGAFAMTVYLLCVFWSLRHIWRDCALTNDRAIYVFQTCFAMWAMIPNKELDMEDDSDDENEHGPANRKDKGVEMQPTPPPLQMPFTPRTQAFHALENKLTYA
jgi:hypothetical protein